MRFLSSRFSVCTFWCAALVLFALVAAGVTAFNSLSPAGQALAAPPAESSQPSTALALKPGDKLVLVGNTLAERMQHFGYFETLLHSRFPQHQLIVRNLGWSADEVTLRPRSRDFDDHGHRLEDHQPDVILAAFGFNESFAGAEGLADFERDLKEFLEKTTTTAYNGQQPPRLVLLSPIAHENLDDRLLPDGEKNNVNLKIYTEAMQRVAAEHDVLFVDLFQPTLRLMHESDQPLTINGIHLNDAGYHALAPILDEALFGARPANARQLDQLADLRQAILERNQQFFYDYRAVNGYYIYGGRKEPFGVVNFPAEFAKLRKMTEARDQRIWALAQGQSVSEQIDDSQSGELAKIVSNAEDPAPILSPDQAQQSFSLPDGYEINLFASEVEFPDLQNPVALAFDAQGRLWVTAAPSYPQYLPGGGEVNDKVLILEDTNADGRADKQTVFADKLYLPNGIELGNGGAYVAEQPNLSFLRDTDGDDRADSKDLLLHGFDSADSHHAISAFEWGPGGGLYFMEGTFHRSQVETPYGPVRLADAGVFRWEPNTWKMDVFVSYNFANPWGMCFDRWGQSFVADASPGNNYFGAAFSGAVDYPRKHGNLQTFLIKQWRPTCGCEIVSSRNFPDEAQGNYLLNNVIGFQGILQYRFRDESSGFAAEPVEPLLRSSDPTFRPVDLQFGPDGALYVLDWSNPLIGHMQHSIRDPQRDTTHGRIWRIHYTKRPLVEPAQIAGQPVSHLLDLLKVYEDRTRYRTRRELRERPVEEVMTELERWVADLDPQDPDYWHHLLEALWIHQQRDVVDEELLAKLLNSPEPRARAAATHFIAYWHDRLSDPFALLRQRVQDEHPRVRLEAVRALSFFDEAEAITALEVAVESLLQPQDAYLEYTLKETMDTLEARTK